MARSPLVSSIVALIALSSAAQAKWTEARQAKLYAVESRGEARRNQFSAPFRRNFRSVGRFDTVGDASLSWSGTIVVVNKPSLLAYLCGRRTVYALTNQHVSSKQGKGGASVHYGANILSLSKVMAENAALDYALLQLKLPGLGAGGLRAWQKLRSVGLQQSASVGDRIYSSGFPSRLGLNDALLVGRLRQRRDTLSKVAVLGKIEAIGADIGTGLPTLITNCPSNVGASGSPLFSANTHRMIGLVFAVNAMQTAASGRDILARPVKDLLTDLAVAATRTRGRTGRQLRRLLGRIDLEH
ncbi:MAG: trypsin-like peptidase domain-containing protein [Deltaproteobacteria bacterium]|nr:trypsin-like peptidase domain-containing protein [Deltaproteobacteria bacterium]